MVGCDADGMREVTPRLYGPRIGMVFFAIKFQATLWPTVKGANLCTMGAVSSLSYDRYSTSISSSSSSSRAAVSAAAAAAVSGSSCANCHVNSQQEIKLGYVVIVLR